MLTFSIKSDYLRASMLLGDMRKQLHYATAVALTRGAKIAQSDLRAAMQQAFDRPKPWTLNSLYVEPATKQRLEANIHFKDRWESGSKGSQGTPAGRYLAPQILGGTRVQKAHERALARAGVVPPGYYLVPTWSADFDAYGNMSTGQIIKILSALRANRDVGVTSNLNAAGKSRGKRRTESYFAIVPGRPQGRGGASGGLPPAIYKATGTGKNRKAIPVALLVKESPKYRQRFDFYGLARRSYEANMPRLMGEAIAFAMRTARA